MNSARKERKTSRTFAGSALFVCTVAGVGFVLQVLTGGFDFQLLAAPVNLLLGGAMVLLCVASAWMRGGRFVRWFTGAPMAVCLISALCILALIMGLTPQGATPTSGAAMISARLGFNAMSSSWAFVLVYFMLLMSLGCLVVRRVCDFRPGDWAFYLNHLGLWLALFAAGLGSAEVERYVMRVDEGGTGRVATERNGHPRQLPIAVRLDDFIMEEYPSGTPSARPEPKRFASEIEVFAPDGGSVKGTVEVNRPLKFRGWRIYQYGYDSRAGRESRYSVIEVVRDPWREAVYVGFAMIAAGAVSMIWNGRRKRPASRRSGDGNRVDADGLE